MQICSKRTGEHPRRSKTSTKLLCNFIEITSTWVTSCKFAAYLQSTLLKKTWRAATVYLYLIFLKRYLKKQHLVSSANFHLIFTEKDPQLGSILCIICYYNLHIKKLSVEHISLSNNLFIF